MRDGDLKYVFCEQRLAGTLGVWAEPFVKLRLQKAFNLFQDPYERADITSNTYWDWLLDHVPGVYGAIADVGAFAATFKEYPPRSIPPSFSAYTIMEDTLKEIKAQQKLNELRGLPAEQGTQPRP
jgi:arylsulfatase